MLLLLERPQKSIMDVDLFRFFECQVVLRIFLVIIKTRKLGFKVLPTFQILCLVL